jgi:hypothetical protein
MPGFSDALIKELLDFYFGAAGSPLSAPATIYFSLWTTAPNDNGAYGVEVTGGAVARVGLTNNSTNFPPSTSGVGVIQNGAAVAFGTSGFAWGSIVGVGIHRHLTSTTGANFLGFMAKEFTVGNGDTVTLPVGSVSISVG